jgi:L-alanine-DL-glutamate epimerase-like enolase superfamily enzyme
MAAPVRIAHTHVHSLRLGNGAEALVARVRLADGAAGHGFTLNEEVVVARDMAAWDALGQSRGLPLHAVLGGARREKIALARDEEACVDADWSALRKDVLAGKHAVLRIDPFAFGSVEMALTLAMIAEAFGLGFALLAPNGHPWELQYCATLAAVVKNENVRLIVRGEPPAGEILVAEAPGLGIDWSSEPAFETIRWQC